MTGTESIAESVASRAPPPTAKREQGHRRFLWAVVTGCIVILMLPFADAAPEPVKRDPPESDSGGHAATAPEPVPYDTSQPIQNISDIVPIVKVQPKWPRQAIQDGIEGFVDLEFTIQPDGSVADINVLSARPGKLFVSSATVAISKWKFKPLVVDGEPKARRASQKFEFLLQAGTASVPIAKAYADAADDAFEAKRYAEAHQTYLDLALTGDKYSMYMIGVMHLQGLGVMKDPALGAAWLELAAEGGGRDLGAARDDAVAQLAGEERRRKESLFQKLRGEYGDCAVLVRLLSDESKIHSTRTLIRQREQLHRERCGERASSSAGNR